MTADPSTARPPQWAESLLRLMLRPEDRESVSGDLLEEYRESIVPTLGAWANRWYIRQAAWYALRATWAWGVLVAAIGLWRYLLDTLAPIHYTPGVIALRSSVMSWANIATFAWCAAWHAWRTRRIGAAMLLVTIAAMVGALLAEMGTLACLAAWHDPDTLRAVQGSGGFAEAFIGPPIGLTLFGVVTGLPGAIAGRLASSFYDWSRPKTKSA
jgi:hypothetical protein